MLSVSDRSFQAFARDSENEFLAKLARYLTDEVPRLADISIGEHRALTLQVVDDARSHGFVNEVDIASYAVVAALLGPDFVVRFPGARQILDLPESAPYRARLLEHFTRELFALLED